MALSSWTGGGGGGGWGAGGLRRRQGSVARRPRGPGVAIRVRGRRALSRGAFPASESRRHGGFDASSSAGWPAPVQPTPRREKRLARTRAWKPSRRGRTRRAAGAPVARRPGPRSTRQARGSRARHQSGAGVPPKGRSVFPLAVLHCDDRPPVPRALLLRIPTHSGNAGVGVVCARQRHPPARVFASHRARGGRETRRPTRFAPSFTSPIRLSRVRSSLSPACVSPARIHPLAKRLARLEMHHVPRRARHRRPVAGVPRAPGRAVAHREAAEVADLDATRECQMFRHVREHCLDRGLNVPTREMLALLELWSKVVYG